MDEIKKKILKKLKSINYPGFNRDIVSFGIIKDILFKENKIHFILNVKTDNSEHKENIKSDIINLINNEFSFSQISVDFLDEDRPLHIDHNIMKKLVSNLDIVKKVEKEIGDIYKK